MDIHIKIATRQDIIDACRECTDPSVVKHPDSWANWADYCLAEGPAYAGWHNGQLVVCSGLHIVRPHVANGWLLVTRCSGDKRRSLAYVRALIRAVFGMLEVLKEEFELRTIRTFCLTEFHQAQKLLKAFGFVKKRQLPGNRYYYRWVG